MLRTFQDAKRVLTVGDPSGTTFASTEPTDISERARLPSWG